MPYVAKEDRFRAQSTPRTPGELNFALTMICIGYLERKGLSYTHLNDCFGALTGAAMELNRRVVTPYEDDKIVQNGDVYPEHLIHGDLS